MSEPRGPPAIQPIAEPKMEPNEPPTYAPEPVYVPQLLKSKAELSNIIKDFFISMLFKF